MRLKIFLIFIVVMVKTLDLNRTEVIRYIKTSTEKSKNQFKVLKVEKV